MISPRRYSLLDKLCLGVDQAVRALMDNPKTTAAAYPGKTVQEETMTEEARKQSVALMRINHAGEICAQALYHGQGVASKSPQLQEKMQQAAIEEGDHLNWCRERIQELGGHTSYLNPLWYTGSFCLGMVAGMIGDEWSLGFLAETERQVINHLQGHLHLLKATDPRSYKILEQMEQDEAKHRDEAIAEGARELPDVIKKGMKLTAKIMVKTAYWV